MVSGVLCVLAFAARQPYPVLENIGLSGFEGVHRRGDPRRALTKNNFKRGHEKRARPILLHPVSVIACCREWKTLVKTRHFSRIPIGLFGLVWAFKWLP